MIHLLAVCGALVLTIAIAQINGAAKSSDPFLPYLFLFTGITFCLLYIGQIMKRR